MFSSHIPWLTFGTRINTKDNTLTRIYRIDPLGNVTKSTSQKKKIHHNCWINLNIFSWSCLVLLTSGRSPAVTGVEETRGSNGLVSPPASLQPRPPATATLSNTPHSFSFFYSFFLSFIIHYILFFRGIQFYHLLFFLFVMCTSASLPATTSENTDSL